MLRRLLLLFAVLGCAVASPSAQGRLRFIITPAIAPPGAPTGFSPACGATGVSVNPTLSFTSSGASSYSIKLDTFSPPTTVVAASNSYAANLLPSTLYYWLATGTNSGGSTPSTPSSGCTFTTSAGTFSDHPYRTILTAAKLTELIARKNVPTAEYTTWKTWLDDGYAATTTPAAATTVTSLTSSLSTGGSGTTFTVADATGFPTTAHTVRIGLELVTITSRSGTTFTIASRAAVIDGYATANVAHSSGEGVYYHSAGAGDVPANFGSKMINGSVASALLVRMGVSGYDVKARWALNYLLTVAHAPDAVHNVNNIRWQWPYVAIAFDLLYAELTTSEKAIYADAMRDETQYHIDNPYEAYEYTTGSRQRELEALFYGNHASSDIEAELMMSAASYGDNADAATQWTSAYAKVTTYLLPALLDGPGSGGNGQEGSGYMTEVWTQTLNTLEVIKNAKGIDLYGSIGNYQTNLAKYLLYHSKPGTVAATAKVLTYGDTDEMNFSDEAPNDYSREAADHLMDKLRVSDPTMASYLKYWRDNVCSAANASWTIWHFIWKDPTVVGADYTAALPTIYATPNPYSVGLFTARSAWTDAATWVNFIVGGASNFEHAHGHDNSYQIMRNGVWLSRDLSGYSSQVAPLIGLPGQTFYYGPWQGTQIHNSVSMNGHGSGQGGGMIEPAEVNQTPRQSITTTAAYMRGDVSNGYKVRAGAPQTWVQVGFANDDAQTFIRDFLYIKSDLVAFYDRLVYANATASPSTWHAIFPADPTVAGHKISLTTGGQKIVHDILVPTSPTLTKVSLTTIETSCSGCTHLQGYRVNTTSGATTASEESFQIIQTGASGFSEATPSLLTSTNAYCSQVSTEAFCFMRGASPTASVTFSYTGSPKFRIVGLGISTAYHFTASAGTATLAVATGSGDTTTDSGGVLEFN